MQEGGTHVSGRIPYCTWSPIAEGDFRWATHLEYSVRVKGIIRRKYYDHNGVCKQVILHGCAGTQ